MNLSTCHNNYKIAHVCTVSLPEYFLQHKYIWITEEYFYLVDEIDKYKSLLAERKIGLFTPNYVVGTI